MFEQEKFRYFLILKKDRTFRVEAISSLKDPNVMKVRYNAYDLIELSVHDYFRYIYAFYGGVEQYWNHGKK